MKHCMLMSVLSLLFSLLLPVTVQHAAGISGDEALPEISPAASAAPESAADAFSGFDALTGVTLLRGGRSGNALHGGIPSRRRRRGDAGVL